MNTTLTNNSHPDSCPALVLNADYQPLSYYPLSLWSWQDAIKAVYLDRVNIVSTYDLKVRSPSTEIEIPSVVSLKDYIKPCLLYTSPSPRDQRGSRMPGWA